MGVFALGLGDGIPGRILRRREKCRVASWPRRHRRVGRAPRSDADLIKEDHPDVGHITGHLRGVVSVHPLHLVRAGSKAELEDFPPDRWFHESLDAHAVDKDHQAIGGEARR